MNTCTLQFSKTTYNFIWSMVSRQRKLLTYWILCETIKLFTECKYKKPLQKKYQIYNEDFYIIETRYLFYQIFNLNQQYWMMNKK